MSRFGTYRTLQAPSRLKRSAARKVSNQSGMTLLEILVVLVIIGIVVATAAPPLFRTLESVDFKTTSDEIAADIANLRVEAVLLRDTITLSANLPAGEGETDGVNQSGGDQARAQTPAASFDAQSENTIARPESAQQGGALRQIKVPTGWEIAGDDIVFLKTGVCLGGVVRVKAPSGRSRQLAFRAPDCTLIAPVNSPE